MSLIDQYSDLEFTKILNNSHSYKECMKNLGYNSISGSSLQLLKKRINNLNLSVSHFSKKAVKPVTKEEVFIKDSKVSQKTLRKFFLKENVPYECAICKQQPFWNNKPLTLILDHINGYNTDNRLKNIRWVCPNCNMQLDTTNGKNINHGKRKTNKCLDCNKEINAKSVRCQKCEKARKKSENVLPISKEELAEKIKNQSFVKIGKEYKVSDNTIRKWCKKYNLPYKKREL